MSVVPEISSGDSSQLTAYSLPEVGGVAGQMGPSSLEDGVNLCVRKREDPEAGMHATRPYLGSCPLSKGFPIPGRGILEKKGGKT